MANANGEEDDSLRSQLSHDAARYPRRFYAATSVLPLPRRFHAQNFHLNSGQQKALENDALSRA